MAVEDLTRRRFVQGTAAMGGGLALGGPIAALGARTAEGRVRRVVGYGPLRDTPEQDSGEVFLQLPKGFKYRIISRDNDVMSDGKPTPGIFDGTGCYPGPRGTVVLIRNHENRSRPNEIRVEVPTGKRYDPDPEVRGGNTKLVVDKGTRNVVESFGVLGGTHTNCAGGVTPWESWITCEEIFNYGSVESNVTPGTGVPHGYCFEVPADARRAVNAVPIVDAGRFAHEAVAVHDGILYETEDRGDAAFYRFVPDRKPREWGDLATFGGTLQALKVRNRPNFDADAANPGETYPVEWVTVDEPNPPVETDGQSTRAQAQTKGAALFNRTEGIWEAGGRLYFDCTSGGEAGAGQLWQLTPRGKNGGDLKLIFESPGADVLDAPDNLVIVPDTGDVFLQEDGGGEQFVRGVTKRGEIYDFAKTVLNSTEFCGGCFSPDGRTFFVSQQGDRQGSAPTPQLQAVTYAVWGPFQYE
ncbi:MAG TPA: alkaline phosphatase PhoX [Solirubrobacteraceae bacterium]|nr:alkaline phosphatase PhoX [Solirubrobacteraceae bacterium]